MTQLIVSGKRENIRKALDNIKDIMEGDDMTSGTGNGVTWELRS